ncbi:hypothetical protein M758_10G084500 [Ceratodon purpureus]|nr:hypothetical protein M758_10G084500 [Ceratodon purpureus]
MAPASNVKSAFPALKSQLDNLQHKSPGITLKNCTINSGLPFRSNLRTHLQLLSAVHKEPTISIWTPPLQGFLADSRAVVLLLQPRVKKNVHVYQEHFNKTEWNEKEQNTRLV